MKFRERPQLVIFATAGVMIGGFILFRYLPLRKRMKTAQEARAAQALGITRAEAQSKELPALKEQLQKLEAVAGKFHANVPRQRDLGTFLQYIAGLMNEHHLQEQLIEPGKELETEGLNCIPVSMQCKGKLEQIFEFCKSLQGLARSVRIEQVTLENGREFSGEVSMETKAVIYYRPEAGQG